MSVVGPSWSNPLCNNFRQVWKRTVTSPASAARPARRSSRLVARILREYRGKTKAGRVGFALSRSRAALAQTGRPRYVSVGQWPVGAALREVAAFGCAGADVGLVVFRDGVASVGVAVAESDPYGSRVVVTVVLAEDVGRHLARDMLRGRRPIDERSIRGAVAA
jgi:hypothetical protein